MYAPGTLAYLKGPVALMHIYMARFKMRVKTQRSKG